MTRLGNFQRSLATNFLTKEAQIFGGFLCRLEKHLFKEILLRLVLGNFGGKPDELLVKIWSHCLCLSTTWFRAKKIQTFFLKKWAIPGPFLFILSFQYSQK